jgi:DNA-directed RNA polymerase alpha subunit
MELQILMAELRKTNKKIKFTIWENDELRNTGVDHLELNVRGYRTLMRVGYTTIGDLIDNWNKIDKLRGCGKKTVQEIQYALCKYQYDIIKDKDGYLKEIIELNK